MAIFRRRLPQQADLAPVLASCAFPIFSWSLVWFFHKMPGWLPYLDFWRIFGILSYALAFALLESVFVLLLMILLAIVLPAGWLRDRFAVQGSMVVFLLASWAIFFQGIYVILREWTPAQFLLGAALPPISIVIAGILVRRSRKLGNAVHGLADRLTVFLYVYVPLGLLGIIVVVGRNTVNWLAKLAR